VNFITPFINLFKILNLNKIDYLFYSEGKVYQNNFYNFIVKLNEKSKSKIYYVSSEINDKINLIKNHKNFIFEKQFFLVLNQKQY